MKPRFSSFLLLLLALPAWGQSPPLPAGNEPGRPLNLSLPRDVLVQPSMVIRNDADEVAARNLRQDGDGVEKRTTHRRYGVGYEARQRGMGGGGRGGMGRGR